MTKNVGSNQTESYFIFSPLPFSCDCSSPMLRENGGIYRWKTRQQQAIMRLGYLRIFLRKPKDVLQIHIKRKNLILLKFLFLKKTIKLWRLLGSQATYHKHSETACRFLGFQDDLVPPSKEKLRSGG